MIFTFLGGFLGTQNITIQNSIKIDKGNPFIVNIFVMFV